MPSLRKIDWTSQNFEKAGKNLTQAANEEYLDPLMFRESRDYGKALRDDAMLNYLEKDMAPDKLAAKKARLSGKMKSVLDTKGGVEAINQWNKNRLEDSPPEESTAPGFNPSRFLQNLAEPYIPYTPSPLAPYTNPKGLGIVEGPDFRKTNRFSKSLSEG